MAAIPYFFIGSLQLLSKILGDAATGIGPFDCIGDVPAVTHDPKPLVA